MDKFTEQLTFRDVSEINLKRAVRWHAGSLAEWSPLEWAGAMAGEAGEACNAAKKLRRFDQKIHQRKGDSTHDVNKRDALVAKLAEEIADTFIYLDLLAQREGISLIKAVRDKFNATSEAEGFPERL